MTANAALLTRLRANDMNAMAELYDTFAPGIYAYLYRRVGEQRLAEDMTGDVFVRALAALRKGRSASISLRAWLYRIAHNLTVDHYRRKELDTVPLEEWAPSEDNVPDAVAKLHQQEWLRAALPRLTPDQQQVLTLRFGQSLTARETAHLMGKSEESIRALQHRALAALRRLMQEGSP